MVISFHSLKVFIDTDFVRFGTILWFLNHIPSVQQFTEMLASYKEQLISQKNGSTSTFD